MTINKAILVGRLGKDPELRALQSGAQVCSFTLATSETWKDKQGQKQEKTEWHNIVVFNESLAKLASQYLKKGSRVYIEGQIRTRKYEKDGVDRYTTEIVLGSFDAVLRFLDPAKSEGEGDAPAPRAAAAKPKAKAQVFDDMADDEVPF